MMTDDILQRAVCSPFNTCNLCARGRHDKHTLVTNSQPTEQVSCISYFGRDTNYLNDNDTNIKRNKYAVMHTTVKRGNLVTNT